MKSPVTVTIKDGIVKKVSGDVVDSTLREEYAAYLRGKISERKENANIAELGIGTNDMAKRPDNILESEKYPRHNTYRVGDNSSFRRQGQHSISSGLCVFQADRDVNP